jgi:hypothetical protein
LVALPEQVVPLLKERLKPATAPDSKHVAQLIADLDNNKFAVREAALRELQELGMDAGPALRQGLKVAPSAEARRRMESLLTSPLIYRSPSQLRQYRALQVLERIGTPEAQRVLETLSQGASSARLTQDAKTSLERASNRLRTSPPANRDR